MILVFLGAPGCGKGTQAQYLCERLNFVHFSTGNILRAEIEEKTELGKKIDSIIKSGYLVEDDIILSIIKKNLVQNKSKNVLFDGFPRTLRQAQAFEYILKENGRAIDFVIYFSIDEGFLLERIVGRFNCAECGRVYHDKNMKPQAEGICDNCRGTRFIRREDDTEESFRKRLLIYYESVMPLISFYEQKENLVKIDASQNLEQVRQQLAPYLSDIKE